MASIIEGYNYDVFISYRQKDNKYDGWVTEFVNDLKHELEATFKEDISVYFDENPHDGLLETHDVDSSLKDKLKCLVFIPVISRTYCDPKSFAWEHEFMRFIEQASLERFGLRVRLPNKNVANRVLPVRIHELDYDDIKLFESILGGALRGVEFIYKEPGVNKPLVNDDDEKRNLNGTKYRLQINKVANAIKEIISGLKQEVLQPSKEIIQPDSSLTEVYNKKPVKREKPGKLNNPKLLTGAAVLSILLIAAILLFPKIFKMDKIVSLRSSDRSISLAVMPFQNMTSDTIWNIWQNGIQNEIINNLTNYEELKVRQANAITGMLDRKGFTNYSAFSPSIAGLISKNLGAELFLYGSIKQAGSVLRLNAQLINTKTEEVFKSFNIEGPAREEMIFKYIDALSQEIRNFLIVSELKKEHNPMVQRTVFTNSPEAYRYYVYGVKAFLKEDYSSAINWYSQAISIDSNFVAAVSDLVSMYKYHGMTEEAKELCKRLYQKRDLLPVFWKLSVDWTYSTLFETPYESLRYLKQMQEFDDQLNEHYSLGITYMSLFQYDKAIHELEKSLEIYKKWDDVEVLDYTALGSAYHKAGEYKKEKKLYLEAEKLFPDDPRIIYRYIIVLLSQGDTILANRYIDKYSLISKERADTEIKTISDLGSIYNEAGIPAKAEKYLRQALLMQPDNPERMNELAMLLIDNHLNVNEGLTLIDQAIHINPDNYHYYGTKGWGLYKQGKYREAQKLLEKSWELKPVYDHEIYIRLEEVKRLLQGNYTDR